MWIWLKIKINNKPQTKNTYRMGQKKVYGWSMWNMEFILVIIS